MNVPFRTSEWMVRFFLGELCGVAEALNYVYENPPPKKSGETEGITLLTQYNPHGIFIALEELGYILMGLSFFFIALALTGRTRLETWVRWIFISAFLLVVVAFVIVTINQGLDRQDNFEIAVISIDWLALVVNGVLLSLLFRRG